MSKTDKIGKVFTCANPRCQADVYDPLYRGAWGHCLELEGFHKERHLIQGDDLCFDCWASEWELTKNYPSNQDYLISLIFQRLTAKDIAKKLNVSTKTVYRRKKKLKENIRKNFSIIRNWMAKNTPRKPLYIIEAHNKDDTDY